MTIDKLYKIIKDRQLKMPEGSYVASLFKARQDRIIQKVGEETVELIIASKNTDRTRIVEESTDLLFHLIVLLIVKKISLKEIWQEFARRRK